MNIKLSILKIKVLKRKTIVISIFRRRYNEFEHFNVKFNYINVLTLQKFIRENFIFDFFTN